MFPLKILWDSSHHCTAGAVLFEKSCLQHLWCGFQNRAKNTGPQENELKNAPTMWQKHTCVVFDVLESHVQITQVNTVEYAPRIHIKNMAKICVFDAFHHQRSVKADCVVVLKPAKDTA